MPKRILSVHVAAAGVLTFAISALGADEFALNPFEHEEKCEFVTGLVEKFQDPWGDRVEPIVLNAPWSEALARKVETIEELKAYLSDVGVDVYSEEQLLDLDLRTDRVSVFVLKGGRIQASCG